MTDPTDREPTWNPDAHLDRVYRRGRFLQNRRRGAGIAAGVVAMAAVVALVVANVGGANPGHRILTAGTGRATTTIAPAGAGRSLPAAAPTTTTGAGPGGPAPGPGPGPGPTTAATSRVTTAPTVARTAAPTTATTRPRTTTTAPGADCGPGDLAYSTATDATSYAVGASVSINLVARNVSGRTCTGPSNSGISAVATVSNSAGAVVFRSNPIAITCTNPCIAPVLAPGQSHAYGAGTWDPATPAGSYSAMATRNGVSGGAALFTVR
ncbi:MAG: hypothetical protein QOK39_1597 [Acidimicrobiaceae bacterium]|jgi:hypothetical protein|nr:hypothetical protein [Acidimicrobiaceae bacterium]